MQDATPAIDTVYGKKIASALQAVWQMHKDSSALLREVDTLVSGQASDGPLRGWSPVHGSFITSDLSWEMKRGYYMAEGLYRFYVVAQDNVEQMPLRVRGITIVFFNATGVSITEPMIIGSEFVYLAKPPKGGRTQSVWDAWDAYFYQFDRANRERPITLDGLDLPPQLGHISGGRILARRLYTLQSRADVELFCHSAWLTPKVSLEAVPGTP